MALWNHCFWSRLICGAQRLRFNRCEFLINNLLQALAAVPLCLSDYLRNLSAIETTARPPVTLTAPRDNRCWFTTLRLPARWGVADQVDGVVAAIETRVLPPRVQS